MDVKTKKTIWITIFVCLLIVASILGYFIVKVRTTDRGNESVNGFPGILFSQNVTEEHWQLNVERIGSEKSDYMCTDIMYAVSNRTAGTFAWGYLDDIRDKSKEDYNISWQDKDKENHVTVGDVFIIGKEGGTMGTVKQGDTFRLSHKDSGELVNVLLE